MPNWVFNKIDPLPENVYKKYAGENGELDFNKIIPEPEEITNTVSGSYGYLGKDICNYRKYRESIGEHTENMMIDHNNPLRDRVENLGEDTIKKIGHMAIYNPDKSLNELCKIDKLLDSRYNDYKTVFGNRNYNAIPDEDEEQVYENYISMVENRFKLEKENTDSPNHKVYSKYESLEDMGRKMLDLQEKYGADNWYDWRLCNWGSKWNAGNVSYDEENGSLAFDTPWSIPYPIIAKIADDNPEVKFSGYSEEETGWYYEYHCENGRVFLDAHGEYLYDEETNKRKDTRNVIKDPIGLTYEEIAKKEMETWKKVVNGTD